LKYKKHRPELEFASRKKMKNIRVFILIAVVVLICLPFVANAQEKAVIDSSYYWTGLDGPDNTPPPDTPWVSTRTITTSAPLVIPEDSSLYISAINGFIDSTRIKYLTVEIDASDTLQLDTIIAYIEGLPPIVIDTGITLLDSSFHGGVYIYKFKIKPQPDWEVIQFTNTSGAPITITCIHMGSYCRPTPSLTPLGLIILILMLIAAGYYVYRRRRAVPA
jgi:hypothetical protein